MEISANFLGSSRYFSFSVKFVFNFRVPGVLQYLSEDPDSGHITVGIWDPFDAIMYGMSWCLSVLLILIL